MVNKPVYGWTAESYPDREDVIAHFPDAACCHQTHGTSIHYAPNPGFYGDGDGLFTDISGVLLTVRTADCNGIVLWDDNMTLVMALHAGWKGTASAIISRGIDVFVSHGIDPSRISIHFSPSARSCCYEIGADITHRFQSDLHRFLITRDERLYADLVGMNAYLAEKAGVVRENIIVEPRCTICDESLFSYRRSKTAKRHMVYIRKG
jgi:YfiH family protein